MLFPRSHSQSTSLEVIPMAILNAGFIVAIFSLNNADTANYQYTKDRHDRPDPIDTPLTSLRKYFKFKEIFQQLFSPQPTPHPKITNQTYHDTIEYNHNSKRQRIMNQMKIP